MANHPKNKNRKGIVFNYGKRAGLLEEIGKGYRFTYDPEYLIDPESKNISPTLVKQAEPYFSNYLFPFFYGLLAEGSTKAMQCLRLKLDEKDHFGRLLKTAHSDVIGSVTVKEYE